MRKLYIKTAEKMAEAIRYHLTMVSDEYEKRYSRYLEARDNIKANLKSEGAKEAFEELCEKMDDKLMHELLRQYLF